MTVQVLQWDDECGNSCYDCMAYVSPGNSCHGDRAQIAIRASGACRCRVVDDAPLGRHDLVTTSAAGPISGSVDAVSSNDLIPLSDGPYLGSVNVSTGSGPAFGCSSASPGEISLISKCFLTSRCSFIVPALVSLTSNYSSILSYSPPVNSLTSKCALTLRYLLRSLQMPLADLGDSLWWSTSLSSLTLSSSAILRCSRPWWRLPSLI